MDERHAAWIGRAMRRSSKRKARTTSMTYAATDSRIQQPRPSALGPCAGSPLSLYRELFTVGHRMIFQQMTEQERERCMTMTYGQIRQMILRKYKQLLEKRHRWALRRRNDQQITLALQQLKELKTLIEETYDNQH
jgi:hypothetical protein